ncbi:SMC family ATPase [Candidatus Woesearchaeota archaeon]|nr:SMC family ATPase [Candidatus Woesearchaeota archaeon]
MLIRRLKLKNIRSYVDSELIFPRNYVLLSGDIGSGKSTALLAIEFALFGLLKGELTGSALLRNGRHRGEVELEFEIDQEIVVIKRVLKRGENSVAQEAGVLVVNGHMQEFTAQELKARIFELFGYPKSMISKGKLVYRYTVYTPQEHMKQIINEGAEERLNVIRQLFDIDRFKRIKDNVSLVMRSLRERCRELLGSISDLDEKRALLKRHTQELLGLSESLGPVEIKLKELQNDLVLSKKKLFFLEGQAARVLAAKTSFSILENAVIGIKQNLARLISEKNNLCDEVAKLRQGGIEIDGSQLLAKKSEFYKLQEKIFAVSKDLGEKESIKKISFETKSKIMFLEQCPLCRQNVSIEHKQCIGKECDEKIKVANESFRVLSEEQNLLKEQFVLLRSEIERFSELVSAQELLKDRVERAESRKVSCEKEISLLEVQLDDTVKKISSFKDIMTQQVDVESERKKHEDLVSKQNEQAVQAANIRARKEMITSIRNMLDAEVVKKENSKALFDRLNSKIGWFENEFLEVVEIVEKNILARVHSQFSELFCKWFCMLVDDLEVRLDEEFTPVVIQNGYETALDCLSGGEKTACALAYRLALNRVVNDALSTIRTKEVLILDEPTDGFSNEQLERLGELLAELDSGQVIIVSHEAHMEAFVDSVIRLKKDEHVTSIAY